MRGAALALLIGAGLVFAVGLAGMDRPAAYGQRPVGANPTASGTGFRTAQAGDWMALVGDSPDGRQQLMVIDTKSRAVGVYHIDRSSGQIVLKSVRNVQWDLQMDDFNGGAPSPQEIRLLLPSRN